MKNKLKRILDIVMSLMLPCLMAYELIGQGTHEILGLCMVSLFILHHVMNGQWHKKMFKGKYTAYRTVLTALDILMIIVFIDQAVTGIMMAKHLFPDLPHQVVIEPQTTILLYTDGLNEAFNADKKMFRETGILEEANRALQSGRISPKELIEGMTQAVHDFVGNTEQSDDLTMLAISLAPTDNIHNL